MNKFLYKTIKHTFCKDVAFLVKGIKTHTDGCRLIGVWMNIVNKNNVFSIGKEDVIFITNEQQGNWKEWVTD